MAHAAQLALSVLLFSCPALGALGGRDALPVVLFHGMGDSAQSDGMLAIKARLEAELPGVYVKSVYAGAAPDDARASFFGRVNDQLAAICTEQLEPDVKLRDGYSLVGLSQGGTFARVLAQRCRVPARAVVTLGAQHGGVASLPGCGGASAGALCGTVTKLASFGAYRDFVQQQLVQARAAASRGRAGGRAWR